MKEEIFVYHIPLPDGIHEMVLPCPDGYTVYIDEGLTYEERIREYLHAKNHIRSRDFEKSDVQEIEAESHEEVQLHQEILPLQRKEL